MQLIDILLFSCNSKNHACPLLLLAHKIMKLFMLQALSYWEPFSMSKQQYLHFQQFKSNLCPFLWSSQEKKKENTSRRAVLGNSKSLSVTYFAILSSSPSLQLTIPTAINRLSKTEIIPQENCVQVRTQWMDKEGKGNHKVS